ncbi:MAG: WH2 domain-containing protein [Alphaproteobacteria bacterium]|nr:WH2 domain-containing protein [Alphaproteobacteria bacterium]
MASKSEVDKKHAALQTEHASLQAAKVALDAKHDALLASKSEVDKNHAALQTEHASLQAAKSALDEKHHELLASKSEVDKKHAALQTEHASLQAAKVVLDRKHDALQTEHASLQAAKAASDAKHDALQIEHASLQAAKAALETGEAIRLPIQESGPHPGGAVSPPPPAMGPPPPAGGRGALLGDIHKGLKLRKTEGLKQTEAEKLAAQNLAKAQRLGRGNADLNEEIRQRLLNKKPAIPGAKPAAGAPGVVSPAVQSKPALPLPAWRQKALDRKNAREAGGAGQIKGVDELKREAELQELQAKQRGLKKVPADQMRDRSAPVVRAEGE